MQFAGSVSRPHHFSALVLSAGFGTRLRPLTDEIPKPLVPIGETALLERSLLTLREAGADGLVVNVHHHANRIEELLTTLPMPVEVSREERILGTAGGIAQARRFVREGPLVIVNGDIVGDLPIAPLIEQADEGLVLAVTERPLGQGTVGLGMRGQVVRLRGETFGQEVASGDYMGVAVLGPKCLNSLPKEGCLVGDWALPELRRGGRIGAVVVSTSFEDVGTSGDYLAANLRWLRTRVEDPTGSFIADGASVGAGVELVSSIVGKGAHVHGRGVIQNALILPGAEAHAPLRDVIVTPRGVVIPATGKADVSP
jgi:mannose-1-phosphate guanylyltransferase